MGMMKLLRGQVKGYLDKGSFSKLEGGEARWYTSHQERSRGTGAT